ncbi:MAG: FxsA family protein [Methylophilaceae bacterium]|nr:FxsA family protein [Methylophilaceae bacterium]
MRFLIGLILLAFPVAEIWLLVELAHRYGWWLLLYLVVVGWLGLQLIREEKLLISGRMMQAFAADGNPMKAMLGSARNFFAGVLLIIPGVVTDMIAVVLLLIPVEKIKSPLRANSQENNKENVSYGASDQTNYKSGSKSVNFKDSAKKAANDDIIEGEFTEVKDD